MPKIVAVIPARLSSTRLSEKLLRDLDGKSILQRVYDQALKANLIEEIFIATDSEKIFEHALSFGAKIQMTSPEHQSGTDRIAELASLHPDWDIVVNIQGDEPFINPSDIDAALEPMLLDHKVKMSSIYYETNNLAAVSNPNVVKVVTDLNNNALYFSRALIPHDRDGLDTPIYKKHLGLYCYRRETLLLISKLQKTELESLEKLEQLRAIANGIQIKMIKACSSSIGIDTLEDYQKALEIAKHNLQFD